MYTFTANLCLALTFSMISSSLSARLFHVCLYLEESLRVMCRGSGNETVFMCRGSGNETVHV